MMLDGLRIVPANEASWEDLQTVFGTRGTAPICQCQRFKLQRREAFSRFPAEERARRLREQTNSGGPGARTTSGLVAAAGLAEVSHPSLRRVVMRIDFRDAPTGQ